MKSPKSRQQEFGITLEDACKELQYEVTAALNFMESEFEVGWARAERYYAGECDLPTQAGRSNAVKTEVRDMVRSAMPSIMRVLYQARKPVEYLPSDVKHAAFIEQQGLYINQLFSSSGGYKIFYNSIMQAAKLKIGPIKTWWEEDPMPEYVSYNSLSEEQVEGLKDQYDFEVLAVDESPDVGELYDVRGRKYLPFGKIHIEDFPVYEFFVSRNATDLEGARVHGHHREVTVAEAIELGLECDDWDELMGPSPEDSRAAGQSRARRGYSTDDGERTSADLLQRKILLTEVYCKYDLEGSGKEQRYCFVLGGTTHTYITHYEIEDYCIDVVSLDPQPYTVMGRSIYDLTHEKQDNETSILRAIIDNAHIANNPRYAADPKTTDFDDLMNNAISAPIKTRGTPAVQVVDIPFTAAALYPFLQYLEKDTEQQVGITKAATGLDPDALQSTNKEAVMNTIQMSQGQIELMARNAIETGLIGIFKKMLRLSIRHMDPLQVVRTKGTIIPIDTRMFDPDLAAEPNVGLGNASYQERAATLNFVLAKQEAIMAEYGMDNPFTGLAQIYNTIEDLVEIGGLKDTGRYFNIVTPTMEEKIAQAKAKADAEAAASMPPPMDPSTALLQVEEMRSKIKAMEVEARSKVEETKIQLKAAESAAKLDLDRDKMAQDRVISLREETNRRLDDRIKQEQAANGPNTRTSSSDGVPEPASNARSTNSVDKS
tara:strand:- start:36070 stop:38214 length:2145 start_codon:yes stop_codon:yes gene_type:complete